MSDASDRLRGVAQSPTSPARCRLWPFGEVAGRAIYVGCQRKSGPDLVGASTSARDPEAVISTSTGSIAGSPRCGRMRHQSRDTARPRRCRSSARSSELSPRKLAASFSPDRTKAGFIPHSGATMHFINVGMIGAGQRLSSIGTREASCLECRAT
jgi:hypothetical protein